MADEVVAPVQDPNWQWYVGFVPAIGWDMVFEGPVGLIDSLDREDAPSRIRVRKPSKAEIVQKQMHLIPWAPWYFGMIEGDYEAVIARSMFLWIIPLTKDAAADALKSWVREKPKETGVIVVEEDAEEQTQAAVALAQKRSAIARSLRGEPAFKKV